MESVSRFIPSRRRAALLATACLLVPAFAAEPAALFEREMAKRHQGVEEAQILITKGDEAYHSGQYADAVEAFAGARDLIPAAPATNQLREAVTRRYAQASVAYGQQLVRKGDLPGAHAVIDKVLAKDVAPDDLDAVAFRAQINDPIRTNPAMTAEHGQNVEKVRKLLYTADGAYNLGKYDQAKATYEDVIRIDPTNSAAQRGMERVAAAKSDYDRAAYDHTRAEYLKEVDGAWATAVPRGNEIIPAIGAGEPANGGRVLISNKVKLIILPSVAFDQVTLEEAIDYIRAQSAKFDTTELDPANKGLNFNLELGPAGNEAADRIRSQRLSLRLKNVPVSQVLKYLCDTTHTTFTTDDFAVIIRGPGAVSNEMMTRTFRVAPDFLSSSGEGAASAEPTDPFGAAAKPTEGLLPKRRSAIDVLKANGVSFPEGATATFNSSNSTLIVHNTAANLDLVTQVVESVTQTEPIEVIVTVKMITTEEHRMQELGFDWLLDSFGLGGKGSPPGSDKFTISGGTQGTGGNLGDIPVAPSVTSIKPITAGNRSGDDAITPDGIDQLIAQTSQGFASSHARAPGILALNGMVNSSSFQGIMRGLEQKKGVDVMTSSSVVCRSGQQSSIQSVREFMYATEYEPPKLPNSTGGGTGGASPVTPSNPSAFATRKVGLTLDVLPTISADKNYVDLQLKPELTNFDGYVNFGSPINSTTQPSILNPSTTTVQLTQNTILMPVFSVTRVNTPNITVADGCTVVIGGLLQERKQQVDDKTPILGNLPLLGRFFQSHVSAPVKKAVVITVSVKLVDPTGHPIHNQ